MSDVEPSAAKATYRERLAGCVHTYTSADEAEVLAFRRRMFGEASPECDVEALRRTYGDAAHGALWLYRWQGELVGQQGALRARLSVDGRELDAAWAVNLLVDPHHQLRGIGSVLSERCLAEHDVVMGLEVTAAARRSFVRAGWVDLGRVPLFARALRPSELLRRRGASGLARAAGHLLDAPLSLVDGLVASEARRAGVRLCEVDGFDERVDHLWRRVACRYAVICRRAQRELARFAEPGRYRTLYLQRGDETLGYVVLRHEADADKPAGHIVDFLSAPEWTWLLLGAATRVLRDAGLVVAYCLHTSRHGAQSLARLGFVERPGGWPLMFHPGRLEPRTTATLCSRQSWFLTGGDSNVDRLREGTHHPAPASWTASPPAADRPNRPDAAPVPAA